MRGLRREAKEAWSSPILIFRGREVARQHADEKRTINRGEKLKMMAQHSQEGTVHRF